MKRKRFKENDFKENRLKGNRFKGNRLKRNKLKENKSKDNKLKDNKHKKSKLKGNKLKDKAQLVIFQNIAHNYISLVILANREIKQKVNAKQFKVWNMANHCKLSTTISIQISNHTVNTNRTRLCIGTNQCILWRILRM